MLRRRECYTCAAGLSIFLYLTSLCNQTKTDDNVPAVFFGNGDDFEVERDTVFTAPWMVAVSDAVALWAGSSIPQ